MASSYAVNNRFLNKSSQSYEASLAILH